MGERGDSGTGKRARRPRGKAVVGYRVTVQPPPDDGDPRMEHVLDYLARVIVADLLKYPQGGCSDEAK